MTTTDFENEDWLYIVIDLDHNNKVLEYRTETMSFEALQLFILEETKLNRRQLILHYVAESSLQDLAKVPEKLVEFFDKDNQLLAEEVHEFNKIIRRTMQKFQMTHLLTNLFLCLTLKLNRFSYDIYGK